MRIWPVLGLKLTKSHLAVPSATALIPKLDVSVRKYLVLIHRAESVPPTTSTVLRGVLFGLVPIQVAVKIFAGDTLIVLVVPTSVEILRGVTVIGVVAANILILPVLCR